MSPDERRQKIEQYRTGYEQLVDALANFPQAMWKFRPAPDRWTIHEIIIHITDSEANSYVRCRRFLAEPGSGVLGYDEGKWAQELDYHAQSSSDALELFKWLRHKSYTLIKDLPDEAWAYTVNHSESGLMTLDTWLDIYARHISDHIQQMRMVYGDWVKTSCTAAGLAAEIDTAWKELELSLDQLSERQMTDIQDAQGWNVRDHITHLAAWEQSVLFLFQGKPRHLAFGVAPEKFTHKFIDETNAAARARWISYSADAALKEFRSIHNQLMDEVRRLSDAELNMLVVQFFSQAQAGDPRRVFVIIQQNTSEHFQEHLGWIKTLVA